MEGLEISEINYKHIDDDNDIFRLDSEFFNKESIAIDRQIKQINHIYLDNKRIVSGPFGSALKSESYLSEGVPFVRVENIKGGFYIDDSEIIYISEDNNNRLKNSQLFLDDLVLSKVGNTIGFFARVDERIGHCNISENNIGIKLYDFDTELKHYILSYLNCRLAQQLVLRRRSGNAQPKLNVGDLSYVPIPVFSSELTLLTSKCIVNSNANRRLSRIVYSKAEEILLEELGLKDWKPTSEAVAIKTFADFATSGRLDAEYYQPKYDEIEDRVKKYKNGYVRVKDWYDVLGNPSPTQYTAEGTRVIKTKNVRIPSVDFDSITDHTPENCLKIQKHDLLFASMGVGSLGRLSYIDNDVNDCTIDGTIRVFRAKEANTNNEIPTLVFLTSSYGQELIYKHVIGSTGIISISRENVKNLMIPSFDKDVAIKVSEKVLESQRLKAESKRLLELAKTAVEMAIEQSEDVAIDYINANLEPAKCSFRHDQYLLCKG